jgi:two-component system, chemotaxis family, chemotaxis protein CheY
MRNPADVSVLIFSADVSIGRTLRVALKGIGVRAIHLASDEAQLQEGFATADTQAVVVYVDAAENDSGLEMIRFLRRSPRSRNTRIPIVAVSQSRDLGTVTRVINAGGHEYVLFPASGDALLKKITSARGATRPFIETAEYVGPCRRRRADKAYTGPERRASAPPPPEPKES